MSFHQETFDGLRERGYAVGPFSCRLSEDGQSAHHFVTVDGTEMPVEWARELHAGRVTFAEIADLLAV
jgi:hypothetical protein